MHDDYVIGHEPMGIVEEVGPDVTKVKKVTESSSPLMSPVGSVFLPA